MSVSDQVKDFEDPLMERVNGRKKNGTTSRREVGESGSWWKWSGGLLLLAVLIFGGYSLNQAQLQIRDLHANLEVSHQRLEQVGTELSQSQVQLQSLEKGLTSSQSQIGSQQQELGRYKKLYGDLQNQQQSQTKELQTLSIQKADQREVEALQDQTTAIVQQVGEMDSRLSEASSDISQVRDLSNQNRSEIDSTRAELQGVRSLADSNADEIAGVKRSLDREYYNFELQKNGGVMKVHNVSLSLKRIDLNRQRYNLEIVADGRRIKKSNQHVNEPIFFYVKDVKKPYEILVSRVDKKFVVGYLSVPKS